MVGSKLNNELNKINNWLKANKLSLNVKKTKFMIFRKPQKKVEIPVLHIGGENIDCVNNFNFLGIVLNQHLNWHSHTTKIANKICKIIGILNKLKHILPQQILSTIYTSLIDLVRQRSPPAEAAETKVLGRVFWRLSLPLKTAFGTIGNCHLRSH